MPTKWPNHMTEREMARRIKAASKGEFCGWYCPGCGEDWPRQRKRCPKCGGCTPEKIIRPKQIA